MISHKVRARIKKNKKHPLARTTASDACSFHVVSNPWQDPLCRTKSPEPQNADNPHEQRAESTFQTGRTTGENTLTCLN
jgi:hypothetical protein